MNPFRFAMDLRNSVVLRICLIVISWILGSLSALLFIKLSFISLMYPVFVERVSIVGMIASLILPIFLSYILLCRGYFYTILPVIFLKAFGYMYCYFCITYSFGSAGWLVRAFLLFSDTVAIILLLHFVYRFAAGDNTELLRSFRSAMIVLMLAGCLDYYIISPYIMMLINY